MVCGKQIFLTSMKRDDADGQRPIELSLPIETFWEVQEILKEADYMIAQSEDRSLLSSRYLDLYRKVLPYAVNERDRLWLMDKVKKD